MNNFISV